MDAKTLNWDKKKGRNKISDGFKELDCNGQRSKENNKYANKKICNPIQKKFHLKAKAK